MRKIRRSAVVAVMIVTAVMSVMLSGCRKKYQEVALYKYTENTDGTLTITELTDKGKTEYELTVPQELDGRKVSSIGDGAFRDDTFIKKVTIEDGVEYIGSNAFLSCYNLDEISIPKTVADIGTNAFTETSWYSKQLSVSRNIIINDVLYEADDNKSDYDIKDGIVTIASGVFYNNTNLTRVNIPSSVKNIGTYSFAGCSSLTEIKLPDGLESIGYGAFADSGLKEITVPGSVKDIGQDAFRGIDTVNMQK